ALVIDAAGATVTSVSSEQIPDTAPITINSSASLNVGSGATETVGPLSFNGGSAGGAGGGLLVLGADVTVGQSTGTFGGPVSLGTATRTFTVAAGSSLEFRFNTLSAGSPDAGLVKEGGGLLRFLNTAT